MKIFVDRFFLEGIKFMKLLESLFLILPLRRKNFHNVIKTPIVILSYEIWKLLNAKSFSESMERRFNTPDCTIL